jgi:hypothetical protein
MIGWAMAQSQSSCRSSGGFSIRRMVPPVWVFVSNRRILCFACIRYPFALVPLAFAIEIPAIVSLYLNAEFNLN